MSDEVQEGPQTTQQTAQTIDINDASHINCMTLPKVILTRIDISQLPVLAVENSHPLLENEAFKKKPVGRQPKSKISTKQAILQEKRRSQAKKKDSSPKSKAKGSKQNILSSVKSRVSSRSQGSIKSMLNKTAITTKTDSVKKYKQTMKLNKQSSAKINPKLKKFNIKITKTNNTDSSEDEFLYDELIEELENTSKADASAVKTMREKTTNIKLKQSSGNKALTILKGGIIKRTKLPPDLRPVSTSNSLGTAKRTIGVVSSQSPTQKASPGPTAMSPVVKINKKDSEIYTSTQNPLYDFKPPQPLKPRIGPKQTLKVGPLFNSNTDDNSDEYSEIETLENDYLDVAKFSKSVDASSKIITSTTQNISLKPEVLNCSKGDDDPNLDLIRILSDDTDDAIEIKSTLNAETNAGNGKKNIDTKEESAEKSTVETGNPPVRTIYELMNEISLQHPSWNLHIVPETNAFCIAQVTKGRLGIPTMKKCIELDSINFYGRVYIHQYHIKKFDGMYDSEESILTLFQEIHSIKA